ncbi:hypothetical protein [Aeromonas salmonicida]|uniref:hypothetical protein n=1 Tax=Aeromonas salmonicida TaxID=645 RepID=UPI000B3F9BDE|nr:hypothetical protein [Aeromonas salmonicida]ARW85310.1 hypothetical protein O23A_P3p0011 [Aeromonas salmonicida]
MELEEIETVLAEIDESTLVDIMEGKAALDLRQRYAMRADIVSWARAAGIRVFGTKHMTDSELVALYKEDHGGKEFMAKMEDWAYVQKIAARLPIFMLFMCFVMIVILMLYPHL